MNERKVEIRKAENQRKRVKDKKIFSNGVTGKNHTVIFSARGVITPIERGLEKI